MEDTQMNSIHEGKTRSIFNAVKVHAKHISGRFVEMDDLVQITMEKILKTRFLPQEPSDKWIFACTWNARNDILRKIYIEREYRDFFTPVESISLSYEEDCESFVPSIVYLPSDPYLAQTIDKAIKQLSNVQRQVFLLYVTGATYLQISKMTDTKINTVRTRLHFAKASLRRSLSDCC
jgi:RNA polymerase sigma factor (sigma-70 family)